MPGGGRTGSGPGSGAVGLNQPRESRLCGVAISCVVCFRRERSGLLATMTNLKITVLFKTAHI